jgi:hypothetical protein
VRPGIAEVDEEAIAEILGDMPVKTGDHFGAGLLIRPHHLAQLFRVELAGEHGRAHQITKERGELAALSFRRTRLSSLLGLLGIDDSRRWLWQCSSVSRPHEHGARLVHSILVDLNDFRLEGFKLRQRHLRPMVVDSSARGCPPLPIGSKVRPWCCSSPRT